MNKMDISDKERYHLLIKILEKELGYDYAHRLIDRSEIEYAVMKTNLVLERR